MDPSSSIQQGRNDSSATYNTTEHEKAQTSIAHGNARVTGGRNRALRAYGHLRRHKWPYIGALVAIAALAIVLPVILAWYIPHEIQNAINSNALPIKDGTVGVVNNTHVRIGLTTELSNPRKETVRLSASTLALYNPGSTVGTLSASNSSSNSSSSSSSSQDTIATLQFPAVELRGQQTVNVTIETQTVAVESQPELAAFLQRAYAADSTTVGVRGKPQAHLGSLGYGLSLDKAVAFAGLQALPAMKITALNPTAPTDAGSSLAALNGSLTLTNPSDLTLDLGDVQFSVSSGGALVGRSWVNGLHVVPGTQEIAYDGELYVDEIVDKDANYTNFRKVVSTLDDEGRVHFDIVGLQSLVDGEPLAYLDDVVSQIQLKVAPCYTVAQNAIPLDKQYFEMIDLFDYFGAMSCDETAPLPDL